MPRTPEQEAELQKLKAEVGQIEKPKEEKSGLVPALAGATQGVLFNFADEIWGELAGFASPFADKKKAKEQARNWFKEKESESPKSYLAGELSGAIATGLIPTGVNQAAAIGKIGLLLPKIVKIAESSPKAAKIVSNMFKGTVLGGTDALGRSEENLGQDTATGAAIGGTVSAGLPIIGKLLSKTKDATGRLISGLSKEEIATIRELGEAVNNPKSLETISNEALNTRNVVKGVMKSKADAEDSLLSGFNPENQTNALTANRTPIQELFEKYLQVEQPKYGTDITKKLLKDGLPIEKKEFVGAANQYGDPLANEQAVRHTRQLLKRFEKTHPDGASEYEIKQLVRGLRKNVDFTTGNATQKAELRKETAAALNDYLTMKNAPYRKATIENPKSSSY